jgi:hypothetical protein
MQTTWFQQKVGSAFSAPSRKKLTPARIVAQAQGENSVSSSVPTEYQKKLPPGYSVTALRPPMLRSRFTVRDQGTCRIPSGSNPLYPPLDKIMNIAAGGAATTTDPMRPSWVQQ